MKCKERLNKILCIQWSPLSTGNGVVDFGEFVNMMINQNNNTLDQDELLEAFRTFDGDDKGYIFSNEIRYVMRHMGESIPEQDINEILQDQQESRKRKITFEGKAILPYVSSFCILLLMLQCILFFVPQNLWNSSNRKFEGCSYFSWIYPWNNCPQSSFKEWT